MSTTKLTSGMTEFIGIDDKIDLLQDLIDKRTTSDKHIPGQNGNSSDEAFPQENGLGISSGEIRDSYSTRNGLIIPPNRIDIEAVMLKLNDSRVLNKETILNGDLSKNFLQSQSVVEISEKHDKNGLGIHHDEMSASKGVVENGENTIGDKIRVSKHLDIYMGEYEKLTNPFSISRKSLDSTFKLDEALQKQSTAVDDTYQKGELKSEGAGSDQDEYRSSSDESAASKEKPTEEGSEPTTQFKEQVFQYLNSSEMQSKMKEINNLIEHMATSSFKQPNPAVVGEVKQDDPGKESEGKSRQDDEMTFPKRKSKHSDFEDPEELQLLAKKLKMSMSRDNILQEPSSEESQSYISEQFRLAYEGFFDKVSAGHTSKAFNFAEKIESPKSKMAKAHLNEIADRVLNAMSLDRCFLPKGIDENILRIEENDLDRITKISQNEFINQFTPAVYDFGSLGKDFYPLVCISPNENQTLSESSYKTCKSKGSVVAGSRSSSVQDGRESSTFSGTRLETNDRLSCGFPKLFELFKILVSLGCLFPFLIITYITAKLLNVFFPKGFSKGPKTSSQYRKVNDETSK